MTTARMTGESFDHGVQKEIT